VEVISEVNLFASITFRTASVSSRFRPRIEFWRVTAQKMIGTMRAGTCHRSRVREQPCGQIAIGLRSWHKERFQLFGFAIPK
jgi:hypothetical protein